MCYGAQGCEGVDGRRYYLKLNEEKTEFVLIGTRQQLS